MFNAVFNAFPSSESACGKLVEKSFKIPRIRRFFGVFSTSINSKSWVLYPIDSRASTRNTSVTRAENLSLTMPCLSKAFSEDSDTCFFS